MLFWIFVVIFIGGVMWGILDNWCTMPPWLISGLSGAIALVMLIILVINHVGVDATVASMNVERKSLVYQQEKSLYDNDNDIGKKELYKEIEKWNSSLASNKELQDDLWIGIFIPNIYDQFELIELKGE